MVTSTIFQVSMWLLATSSMWLLAMFISFSYNWLLWIGRKDRADFAKKLIGDRVQVCIHIQLQGDKGLYLLPIHWAKVPAYLKDYEKDFTCEPAPLIRFKPVTTNETVTTTNETITTTNEPVTTTKTDDEPNMCCICMQLEANAQLFPCRHNRICNECVLNVLCGWEKPEAPHCPYCRQPFNAILCFA